MIAARVLSPAALLLMLSLPANAAQTPRECAPVKDLIQTLMQRDGLGYLSQAISAEGRVYMWLVSRTTKNWAQVSVSDDLVACVEMRGVDWRFALE